LVILIKLPVTTFGMFLNIVRVNVMHIKSPLIILKFVEI
jgi:hypothetical protein